MLQQLCTTPHFGVEVVEDLVGVDSAAWLGLVRVRGDPNPSAHLVLDDLDAKVRRGAQLLQHHSARAVARRVADGRLGVPARK